LESGIVVSQVAMLDAGHRQACLLPVLRRPALGLAVVGALEIAASPSERSGHTWRHVAFAEAPRRPYGSAHMRVPTSCAAREVSYRHGPQILPMR
jgi:hypothetical protein